VRHLPPRRSQLKTGTLS